MKVLLAVLSLLASPVLAQPQSPPPPETAQALWVMVQQLTAEKVDALTGKLAAESRVRALEAQIRDMQPKSPETPPPMPKAP